MQSTIGYYRSTVSTQIGPASLMDAPSVCCITDTRDHRSSSAGSSCCHRNRAFVESGAFKVATIVGLTQRFSLLHDNLGHCKSTNRIAPPGLSATPAVFVAALTVKILLLVLDALSKASYSHTQGSDMPERRSGIYSLSFFAWLKPLIYQGNWGNLTVHDLYPVDEHISSQSVNERV
jgi:hypothetical protein